MGKLKTSLGKKKLKFGELLGESLIDYSNNFSSIFKFMIYFIFIPSIIVTSVGIVMLLNDNTLLQIAINSSPSLLDVSLPLYYTLFSIISFIALILLFLFIQAGIINASLGKSEFSFADLISSAKSRYLGFVIFNMVLIAFLGILFLLLIIPGIILGVYWILGVYVFYNKRKGILFSLKSSKDIIKRNWWKVFSYLIIISIMIAGIFVLREIILSLIGGVLGSLFFGENLTNTKIFLSVYLIFETILNFIANLLYLPISLIFFKNLYLGLRK